MRRLMETVSEALGPVLTEMGLLDVDPKSIIGPATDKAHGDLAMPCHQFSRILKRSPIKIADEAAEKMNELLDGIASASSAAGFLNITAESRWLADRLSELVEDPLKGVEKNSTRTVVVDYSSPNIAKEMHVGHLRSTVIGDSLVRILEMKGNKVIRENHIGDWGTPFGMLIERLEDLESEGVQPSDALADLGLFYRDARTSFDSDKNFRERARKRVVALQSGDKATMVRWRQLVDLSLSYFEEVYDLLGVLLTKDDVRGESFYDPLLGSVVDRLEQKALLKNESGAEVMYPGDWLNREGNPLPLIIKKSDGGYNYATSDLACIIDRTERLGADDLVYVVGTEQKQHFEMVFAAARIAGFLGEQQTSKHIQFGLVLGPDGGKLKSRSGKAIRLLDLLREAIERASGAVSNRNPNMTPTEIETIAKSIGIGAVKYSDLKADRTKDYVFDWDRMLSFEGETGPYLQYAHARIRSIIARSDEEESTERPVTFTLPSNHEARLARELLAFSDAVDTAAIELAPHKICKQLHKISQAFGSFYEHCPVLIENDSLRLERISLCNLTGSILKTGLELLGIDAPTRM